MPESSAFISYHSEDRIIGETLFDQLSFLANRGEGRRSVSCFLDVKDIPPGSPWKPIIDHNLASKDWLIVIFTGDQSVYSGYEIGTFLQLHAQTPDKRIMGLYDVPDEKLPVVLRDGQNTPVASPDKVVETAVVTVSAEEVTFWYNSAIGKFLVEFCTYRGLYTPGHEKTDPAAYGSSIALAAKRVANAFGLARGTDVKSETPTQIGFELTIKGVGEFGLERIPGNSTIVGTSLFFDVLGLALPVAWDQAPNTTWEQLKRLLGAGGRKNVPWMHKVEADVVRAASAQIVSAEDVTFRGQNGKIYRPIMVRHKYFVNGDRKFYLLFVETLDRRFAGSKQSSLLLTGLILASRWRFTYFEKWSDTIERIFSEEIPLANFTDNCKQLLYNIEWIEHEAAELGTSDTAALIDAFGSTHRARVERFFTDWENAKKALFASLPDGINTEITQANRNATRQAVLAFLQGTREQNADFLELAIQAYGTQVASDLAKERTP